MKRLLLLISSILISLVSFGQWQLQDNYNLTFEDTASLNHLIIDTASSPNNSWRVGRPQKTMFTSANSPSNAIVTDTVNSYLTNDTSIFIIKNIAFGGGFYYQHTVTLAGEFFVNSDTLTDYGTIEFSPDQGATWIDLINNATYDSYIMWYSIKPTLTGNSNGWTHFEVNIAQLGHLFNLVDGDTLLYRFTFISDNVQTNKDGLMFDDFDFKDYVEGIDEYYDNTLISIFPNPAADNITINGPPSGQIQIFSDNGELLYQDRITARYTLDTKKFENGVYFVKYVSENNSSLKKFMIQR